ncbi:heme exporter protein CcmD [Rhodothalassium salexigens]|uniref:Heme exporter protein D n=1 Tax=Rhodothalassium salexigens DSM 2132 TaxID=1188247 RepID=A0A4R2PBM4_RHOSA|nr:heme exporter protein CcmD [Rhodothalassium salexigens]MBB4212329.1 heme exporter protein D [Rhodothalassium salexigens DSM 2132]MBK1638829.1 heme exporter protein CcmD [Rhodothalassium salexigens DSM 2132]MBK5910460.1 heme exporter protein CcmD [Rhodothalassium salexigens]MBK5921722.1 heme exporter protein CcmD [Rhodothalassium salexigens]TCP32520.1 heme exporter protein D [Rhodothalassium salexigens DSM 2132]
MSEFFAMGGYGAYIWPCYGLTLIGMVALAGWSFAKQRRLTREAERLKALGKESRQ